MKKTYKKKEEKLTSEGAELRQPVAELEAPITEHKQAREKLQESEQKYRTIFENVSDIIIHLDKYGKVLDINGKAEDCFGYKPDEVIGRNFARIGALSLKDLPKIVKLFGETISGKRAPSIIELEAKRKDGSTVLLEVNTTLVKKEGKIEGTIAIIRDVTERKQAENELRKFKTISDKAGYGITIVNLEGNVSYVNASFARIHGYTPDELIGQHLSIFHTEQQMAKVNRLIKQLNREGSYVAEEVGHKRKDSTEFTTLMNGTLVKDEQGTPLFMAATVVDITERKQMEEELREAEFRYRTVANSTYDWEYLENPDGTYRYVSPSCERITGYEVDEFISNPDLLRGIVVVEDKEKWLEHHRQVAQERGEHEVQFRIQRKDGETCWIEQAGRPVIDDQGRFLGYRASNRDVTDRKQVEEALKESEEFNISLLANSPNPIIVVNPDNSIRYVNPAHEKLTGFSLAELIGLKAPYPYWPEERVKKITSDLETAMRRKTVRIEELFRNKSGEQFWVEITSAPISKDGKFKYLLANWVDITERKQAEEALQAILKTALDGFYLADLEGKLLEVNDSYCKMIGYTREELLKMSTRDIEAIESPEEIAQHIKKVMAQGSDRFESRHKRKDGQIINVEISVNYLDVGEGQLFVFARDITERKQVEEALRDSEEKSRKMFESVSDSISVIDLSGIITQTNQRTVEIHGFSSREEMVGMNAFDLVAPRDRERIARNMRQALKRGIIRDQEYTLLRADGSEFPAELSTSVLKDASGKVTSHITIARDITERKQAEEREKELQKELLLSSRLASIGELAAGIAHQINNPLTGVLGFSQRLLRKSTDQETNQDLKRIYTEAERAAKVVQNLLTFARRRQPQKQDSDINEILESALELRAYELTTSNIEVVTDLAPGLPELMLDFQQIQEVFLNIILNAEQAMTEANGGGKLTIKTKERKGYIRTTFTDNGPGIPAKNLEKIFDPFFSTKGEKGGTGLGLSVCHGIISEHGGRIYARSKPGEGATFFIELPVPEH
jgi:PAS domain S-box-containing protein